MGQVYEITKQTTYKLALRRYSENGPAFLVKLSKITGDILSIERLENLPSNWPKEFIDQLFENGKVLQSKVFSESIKS